MTHMIRKQVYLEKRHDQLLKRLAKARRVSEAEVIRQALEREAQAGSGKPMPADRSALDALITFALQRRAGAGRPYTWNREELYEDRGSRADRPRQNKA